MTMLCPDSNKNGVSVFCILFGILLCVGFLGSVNAAEPDGLVVGKIETSGNRYISGTKIFATVRTRQGQLFDSAQASEDVKRIAELKGIRGAYYNTEVVDGKVNLTFVIMERIAVRSITFTGNKQYSDKKLSGLLDFKRGDFADNFTVEAGREKLLEYYLKKGYAFVKVDFDQTQMDEGKIHYNIETGSRVKIRKTKFAGNDSIKTSELKKVIKSGPRKLLVLQNHFQNKALENDILELRRAYDRKGYLDAAINAEQVFNSKKNKVDIVFNVKEGPRYKIEGIVISGNKFFDVDTIKKEFKLKVGDYYSDEISNEDAGEILRIYRQIGFVEVTVTHKRSFSSPEKVLSEFEINEGGQFRIGVVNITGNQNAQDRVIRRVLDEDDFKPGELYNAHIAAGDGSGKLEQEVKENTYAESITIIPVDVNIPSDINTPIDVKAPTGEKPSQKDAEVRITEGKTGSIMFGAGVSSQDGLIGQVVYDQRNFDIKDWPESWKEFLSNEAFKGAGQRLRISLEPGTDVSEYSISFTEPYLHDKPTSLDVVASAYEREMESYDEKRLKSSVGFKQRRKEGRYRSLGFRFENVNVGAVEAGAPSDVSKVKGDNLLAGIRLGFGRDLTDSKMNPTKGRSYDVGYEQVGGDHTFGIASGTYRWYKTLHEDLARRKTVLELKLHAATIVGEAPTFERFYMGGIRSLRGFDYRGISPRAGADNDPIGSNWIGTISSEVSVPLVGKSMAALFFVDTGMIDTGGPRASIGTGIQLMIPQWFGQVPLRFELALPFMKDGDDDTQVFHFSVGRLF